MNCFVHAEAEAVAICVHCGKGLCPHCAGKSESGRIVCSPACAASRFARWSRVNGHYLYSLTALFVAAASYYLSQNLWQLSVFLGLAAFGCGFAGRRSLRQERDEASLSALYYRTGDAMEKVHAFRRRLGQLLALHARFADSPVSLPQLDGAEEKQRAART